MPRVKGSKNYKKSADKVKYRPYRGEFNDRVTNLVVVEGETEAKKLCPVCKKIFPYTTEHFYTHMKKNDGTYRLKPKCKACFLKQKRERSKTEGARRKAREYARRYRQRKKAEGKNN